ncbi:DNA replication and repair protein RecO [Desulfotomaculum arcticum]|uniref:DNA repair protein RecO n=1 Tax=Desulfotruncus arcticus DSM 17038 TaxID=1121424 RepID=A0A1I2XHA2_9FIRM|nr:DNA repair protein RecO [Desulfotruncus arcticus]SFH12409.1 DNA replication and repair protein RecO [Desulfotomaculum arcticum] [Desulfotruncus arcticus DSM 17038]
MQLYRVQAIVLNSYEMRDAHRVLTLYTREKGKVRAVAHGVAKPTSKKRGAVQPFCHTDFLLRRGRELDSVSQCEGREIFPALWADLDLMSYAGHATGLVDRLTADGEPDQHIFSLLLGILRVLEKTKKPELAIRSFELRLVSLLGYLPHLDSCTNCGETNLSPNSYFSPGAGGLVCRNCRTPGTADCFCGGEAVSVLKALLNWELVTVERIRITRQAGAQIKLIMTEYLKWLTERRSGPLEFMEKVRDYKP